jgi:repressor LexA
VSIPAPLPAPRGRRSTRLTSRQRQVLETIAGYIRAHGFSPSLRDIAAALAIRSAATVSAHIEALERKGYIARVPSIPRTITIIRHPDAPAEAPRRDHAPDGPA